MSLTRYFASAKKRDLKQRTVVGGWCGGDDIPTKTKREDSSTYKIFRE